MRNFAPIAFGLSLLAGALIWAALAPAQNDKSNNGTTTWSVKVTNLTAAPDGQPLSPPVWAVHNDKFVMWRTGQQATNGAALIMEDAIAMPLAGLMAKNKQQIFGSKVELPPETDPPTPPPILPGNQSRTFTVQTTKGYDRLSILTMLVRTNDAFTGLDSLKVKAGTFNVNAYDAGTEKNNEVGSFIPGPPFGHMFVRDQDAQLIAPHPGLRQDGELAAYIWQDPVARIEIKRLP